MSIDRAATLYYSDDPENLSHAIQGRTDGVLFDFDLVAGPPQRFIIYHVNGDSPERTLALRFFNDSGGVARVSYVKSLPEASADYLTIGHRSTLGFLRALQENAVKTVEVASGENVIGEQIRLSSEGLASGFFELALVVGSKVRVSLIATSNPDNIITVAREGNTFRLDAFGRRGKFDISDKTPITVACDATKPCVVARLGQRKFPNLEHRADGTLGNVLKGEYGVFTTVDLKLNNPTSQPLHVALYQSAHGGESTASYLIDGLLVESGLMPCTDPYPRYKLLKFLVPAHSETSSTILTMPDNASNSPVVLTIDHDDINDVDPDSPGSLIAYRRFDSTTSPLRTTAIA